MLVVRTPLDPTAPPKIHEAGHAVTSVALRTGVIGVAMTPDVETMARTNYRRVRFMDRSRDFFGRDWWSNSPATGRSGFLAADPRVE
jgi:hypothetical protein